MTVNQCLERMTDVGFKILKLCEVADGEAIIERMINDFTTTEFVAILGKNVVTYYSLGNMWYVLYRG